MTTEQRPAESTGLALPLLIGAAAPIAIGLLAPLLVGSFGGAQLVLLVALEAACLLAVAAAAVLLARRLAAGHRALWDLSRRDELTGVGNYRALRERLDEEISRHARRRRQFALILIDLDGFKRVNEELGHLEGDRVLAEIGAALLGVVRAEDWVFRQGGDEFAVIAPETGPEEAAEVAGRLGSRVATCAAGGLPVSAAIGSAIFPADGRGGEELLRYADDALLNAKRVRRGGHEYRIDIPGDGAELSIKPTGSEVPPSARRGGPPGS